MVVDLSRLCDSKPRYYKTKILSKISLSFLSFLVFYAILSMVAMPTGYKLVAFKLSCYDIIIILTTKMQMLSSCE